MIFHTSNFLGFFDTKLVPQPTLLVSIWLFILQWQLDKLWFELVVEVVFSRCSGLMWGLWTPMGSCMVLGPVGVYCTPVLPNLSNNLQWTKFICLKFAIIRKSSVLGQFNSVLEGATWNSKTQHILALKYQARSNSSSIICV